ncbi:OadG family protein [Shewanella psychrotolerans]|uniref:OadG family protein n=1 Tax=Shewanella psychrotolerans TaxID=2864206 RepID=UPI001C65D6A2|nr:OadG family transporter subunit [Shewanella psychrotolerans]QYK02382.1 OadG family protein [Shewanella psychrotolerans]
MDSIAQQIIEALAIMVLGMGLVFLFLSILILAVNLVAWKFAPAPSLSSEAEDKPHLQQNIEPKLVAAITAAIHQYRAKA